MRSTGIGLVSIVLAAALGGVVEAEDLEYQFRPVPKTSPAKALPPIPPVSLQLVLDDDASEGTFGVGAPSARQFLWFNRFSPGSAAYRLDEIWVLFPPGPNMAVGGAVDLVVYHDPDGNPANGADLVATFNETIQVVDGNTFSVYPISPGLVFNRPGDILIGVIGRFVVSGATPSTQPAAIDTTASQGRSWLAVWSGDPPDPAILPADSIHSTIDGFVAGNWMIRGFGEQLEVSGIPAQTHAGIALLVGLMAIAGALLLARRQ